MKQSKLTLFKDLTGNEVIVPILELQGNRPGPHLLITASIHGDEPISTIAALEILEAYKNQDFAGSLTVFSCLNTAGTVANERGYTFESQSFTGSSPNLNRMFGREDRTITTQTANAIFAEILKRKPSFVIDAHSYAKDSLVHVIVDRPGGELEDTIITTTRKSAVPFYLEYEATSLAEQVLDHSLSMQLCLKKVPAVTLELGPRRGFSQSELARAVASMRNFLSSLGMIQEKPQSIFVDQPSALKSDTLYQRFPLWVSGDGCGLFVPRCSTGTYLEAGACIGEIKDLFGRVVEKITMPEAGIIIQLTDDAYSYPRKQIGVAVRTIACCN